MTNSEGNFVKKKIFVITQPEVVDTVGGAITVFINFCNLLAENNYEVYGICYSEKENRPNLLKSEVNFVNLKYYYDEFPFSKAVNNFAEEKQPDLMIFFFHYLYIDANLDEKFSDIPRILMFHSRPDFYFKIHKDAEEKLRPLYKSTVTQVLCGSFKNLLPDYIKDGKVVVIPNSVEISDKIADIKKEKKKIIYLSRIDNCKGLEFLIKSFNKIAKKYKDWSIDIFGQSQPENYVEELKRMTKKMKLDKQIIFKGITKNPVETFLNYDFCVFPSFFEGFPIGLLEAQSVGLPCIGLKGCSGVNEMIIDNETGFLAEKDYTDFASKIEKLISDKNLREMFSEKTLSFVSQFERNKVNQMWLNLISGILENNYTGFVSENTLNTNDYKLFDIDEIVKIANRSEKKKYKFLKYIFSIYNDYKSGEKFKIVYFLGIKLKIKCRD